MSGIVAQSCLLLRREGACPPEQFAIAWHPLTQLRVRLGSASPTLLTPPPPGPLIGGGGKGEGGCSYRCRPIEIRSSPAAAGITSSRAASRGSHGGRAIGSRGRRKRKSASPIEPILRDSVLMISAACASLIDQARCASR